MPSFFQRVLSRGKVSGKYTSKFPTDNELTEKQKILDSFLIPIPLQDEQLFKICERSQFNYNEETYKSTNRPKKGRVFSYYTDEIQVSPKAPSKFVLTLENELHDEHRFELNDLITKDIRFALNYADKNFLLKTIQNILRAIVNSGDFENHDYLCPYYVNIHINIYDDNYANFATISSSSYYSALQKKYNSFAICLDFEEDALTVVEALFGKNSNLKELTVTKVDARYTDLKRKSFFQKKYPEVNVEYLIKNSKQEFQANLNNRRDAFDDLDISCHESEHRQGPQ